MKPHHASEVILFYGWNVKHRDVKTPAHHVLTEPGRVLCDLLRISGFTVPEPKSRRAKKAAEEEAKS